MSLFSIYIFHSICIYYIILKKISLCGNNCQSRCQVWHYWIYFNSVLAGFLGNYESKNNPLADATVRYYFQIDWRERGRLLRKHRSLGSSAASVQAPDYGKSYTYASENRRSSRFYCAEPVSEQRAALLRIGPWGEGRGRGAPLFDFHCPSGDAAVWGIAISRLIRWDLIKPPGSSCGRRDFAADQLLIDRSLMRLRSFMDRFTFLLRLPLPWDTPRPILNPTGALSSWLSIGLRNTRRRPPGGPSIDNR